MAVKGVIQYQGLHPKKLQRDLRAAVKAANRETVVYWHGQFLPNHFKRGAAVKYRYRKRTEQYNRRKRRMGGSRPALVFSGTLRTNALRQIVVSGTSKSARGRLPGTQVANFHAQQSPSMREEIVRTTNLEEQDMANFHASVVAEEVQKKPDRRRVRV